MYRTTTKAAVSWIILAMFMGITQPAKVPVWGLIIPFVILYFAVRYTLKAALENVTHTNPRNLRLEKWLPLLVSVSTVVILALQSIGQLSLRDVTAVILVVALGYFYVHRNGSKEKK
jgi:phosphatidylglycerophosphate synthase